MFKSYHISLQMNDEYQYCLVPIFIFTFVFKEQYPIYKRNNSRNEINCQVKEWSPLITCHTFWFHLFENQYYFRHIYSDKIIKEENKPIRTLVYGIQLRKWTHVMDVQLNVCLLWLSKIFKPLELNVQPLLISTCLWLSINITMLHCFVGDSRIQYSIN